MPNYPPSLVDDEGNRRCPCEEWLDGMYRVDCRRLLDAEGRCPKHYGYRPPADTQT